MFDIISGKKMDNGIVVFWLDEDNKRFDSFTYEELIDQKVNAFDLLNNPQNYQIDPAAKTIESKV
jgi:hypothetical protein